MATVYFSSDPSAPQLTGTAGSLINVLDACLVNGYGAKSPAGWTKPYSGTNVASYRMTTTSPATGRYLRVNDTGDKTARIVGYSEMVNVNDGAFPFPNNTQVTDGLHVIKSSTNNTTSRPWAVVATNRSFYLFVFCNSTVFGQSKSGWDYVYFFGDVISRKENDVYNCAIIAPDIPPGTVDLNNMQYFGQMSYEGTDPQNGHYLERGYTGTPTPQQFYKSRTYSWNYNASVMGVDLVGHGAEPVSNSINFAEVMVHESPTILRGTMPGFYEIINGAALFDNFFITYEPQGLMSGSTLLIVPVSFTTNKGRCAINISGDWY